MAESRSKQQDPTQNYRYEMAGRARRLVDALLKAEQILEDRSIVGLKVSKSIDFIEKLDAAAKGYRPDSVRTMAVIDMIADIGEAYATKPGEVSESRGGKILAEAFLFQLKVIAPDAVPLMKKEAVIEAIRRWSSSARGKWKSVAQLLEDAKLSTASPESLKRLYAKHRRPHVKGE